MHQELFVSMAQSNIDGHFDLAVELAHQAIAAGSDLLDVFVAVTSAKQLAGVI